MVLMEGTPGPGPASSAIRKGWRRSRVVTPRFLPLPFAPFGGHLFGADHFICPKPTADGIKDLTPSAGLIFTDYGYFRPHVVFTPPKPTANGNLENKPDSGFIFSAFAAGRPLRTFPPASCGPRAVAAGGGEAAGGGGHPLPGAGGPRGPRPPHLEHRCATTCWWSRGSVRIAPTRAP